MDLSTLNVWAIIVAAVSTFVIGGLWYSPLLFAKAWMSAAGVTQEQLEHANMAKIYGLALLFQLVMALNLAMFLNDPAIGTGEGALYGFFAGFGWVFLALAVNSLFERRSWKYMLINGGYWTVAFTVMGLILGAWK